MRPEELDDVFAGLILKKRADSLLHELAVLKRHPHKDSIHDTRVQSRRMRAALEAFQSLVPPDSWEAVYNSVRGITRVLGRVRESEVSLSLLEELTASSDQPQKLCGEYLKERLGRKLSKLHTRLRKSLKKVAIRDLRSRNMLLLEGLGQTASRGTTGAVVTPIKRRRNLSGQGRPANKTVQPFLFALHGETIERARQALSELAAPLLAFRPRSDFRRATDTRLHRLRISAKKLRYAMEIFDEVWPGGLKEHIEMARALQDSAGRYHDWAVLCRRLQREIRRLSQHCLSELASQMERILADGESRKFELRKEILPPLIRLQTYMRDLLQNPPLPGQHEDLNESEAAS